MLDCYVYPAGTFWGAKASPQKYPGASSAGRSAWWSSSTPTEMRGGEWIQGIYFLLMILNLDFLLIIFIYFPIEFYH